MGLLNHVLLPMRRGVAEATFFAIYRSKDRHVIMKYAPAPPMLTPIRD